MKAIITILLLGLSHFISAQPGDPYVGMYPYVSVKSYTVLEGSIAVTNTGSRNNNIKDYQLVKGKYNPSFNIGLLYIKNNLFNNASFITSYKTGLTFYNNSLSLADTIGNRLTFSEINLSLPFMIGICKPNYNKPNDQFFKAVNFNIGGFISLPLFPSLYGDGEFFDKTVGVFSDYVKYGIIAEFEFSALNNEGKGHRIGIRTIADLGNIITFSKEKYGIHPTYISVGIFYNFITFKKK